MNVGIIGFACSGKSSLTYLASKYFDSVLDTDEQLSKIIGEDFLCFIRENGEELFREREFEVISDLQGLKNSFVSFGGGFNFSHKAYSLIKDSFKFIYIYEKFETLLSRAVKEQRPFLTLYGEEKYKSLYENRLELYKKSSDYIVTSGEREISLIWNDVEWIIDTFLR